MNDGKSHTSTQTRTPARTDPRPHVVFGVSSWGLGHATRDLVLLHALVRSGWRVTIVATGPALRVLQRELGKTCQYLDWPDMPSSIAGSLLGFVLKTTALLPRILRTWFSERARTRMLVKRERVDLIISDHRYGMVRSRVPTCFVTHSLRYIAPWRSRFMETAMELFMCQWLSRVQKVLVPDELDGGLSGEMGHGYRYFPRSKVEYLGILSSVTRNGEAHGPQRKDVDVFISLSGPEPQRTRLSEIVLAQLPMLASKFHVVVALGLPDREPPAAPAGAEVHAYLDRDAQQRMMNQAGLIVCRSGYTTLMELAELGKCALLIPTPGQTEQLYLARTLRRRGLFYSVAQDELNLTRDVAIARDYPGYRPRRETRASVQRFLHVIDQLRAGPRK